jgi:hypothetical protein
LGGVGLGVAGQVGFGVLSATLERFEC